MVPSHGWVTVADTPADKKDEEQEQAIDRRETCRRGYRGNGRNDAPPQHPPHTDPVIVAGRMRFNDQCSHCHGSDGASPVRERDVRRLSMRYDADKWRDVAAKTIKEGRNDLGMPAWKDS